MGQRDLALCQNRPVIRRCDLASHQNHPGIGQRDLALCRNHPTIVFSIRTLPLLQGKSPKGDGYNIKNIVFKALRPRNAPKTLFLKLCGPRFIPLRTLNDPLRARVAPLRALNDPLRPRFVPLRSLNDLSRARVAPLRGLNDPLRPRVAPLRGLNAHCDLALCQNHPTISSPVARKVPAGEWGQYGVKTRKMRESA